jgi:hypothetical protein
MLSPMSIIADARAECGTELSKQAIAVINAMCKAIESQHLHDLEALKQENAVKQTPTGRMKRPTIDEIKLHGAKIGLPEIECEKYFNHYESNGWKVGQNPMKLWTAGMANWKRTWTERGGVPEVIGIPSLRNVVAHAQEKDPKANGYAISWFQYWTEKKWKRKGNFIDWKIEFSKSYSTHKAQAGGQNDT